MFMEDHFKPGIRQHRWHHPLLIYHKDQIADNVLHLIPCCIDDF